MAALPGSAGRVVQRAAVIAPCLTATDSERLTAVHRAVWGPARLLFVDFVVGIAQQRGARQGAAPTVTTMRGKGEGRAGKGGRWRTGAAGAGGRGKRWWARPTLVGCAWAA